MTGNPFEEFLNKIEHLSLTYRNKEFRKLLESRGLYNKPTFPFRYAKLQKVEYPNTKSQWIFYYGELDENGKSKSVKDAHSWYY